VIADYQTRLAGVFAWLIFRCKSKFVSARLGNTLSRLRIWPMIVGSSRFRTGGDRARCQWYSPAVRQM